MRISKNEAYVLLGVGLAVAAVGAAVIAHPGYNLTGHGPELTGGTYREFVCTDDDKLVERHVGVDAATLFTASRTWKIIYVEGNAAYYVQPSGEVCAVEEYTPPVQITETVCKKGECVSTSTNSASSAKGCDNGECVNSGAGYE